MKALFLLTCCLAFSTLASAGFSLSGQPEIKQEVYNAQLAMLREKALKSIEVNDSIAVFEDELTIAPLVLDIDFQKLIKVAQGASVLGEYSSLIDLELATWGFQEVVDRADEKITGKLEEKLGGTVYPIDDATESADNSIFTTFPTKMPNLNQTMPNYEKKLIAYESFAFDTDDILAATRIELADKDDEDGVVFFPYINLALHKQSATTSQMNGELMINYKAAINGYFALCVKVACFIAAIPNNGYIDLVIPLVHRKEATSDETQMAALDYSQELMAQMIAEFTMAAFDKLTEPDPE